MEVLKQWLSWANFFLFCCDYCSLFNLLLTSLLRTVIVGFVEQSIVSLTGVRRDFRSYLAEAIHYLQEERPPSAEWLVNATSIDGDRAGSRAWVLWSLVQCIFVVNNLPLTGR